MNAGVNIFNTKFSYFNCKPDSLVTLLLVTLLQVISNYFDQLFTMFKIRIKYLHIIAIVSHFQLK